MIEALQGLISATYLLCRKIRHSAVPNITPHPDGLDPAQAQAAGPGARRLPASRLLDPH